MILSTSFNFYTDLQLYNWDVFLTNCLLGERSDYKDDKNLEVVCWKKGKK